MQNHTYISRGKKPYQQYQFRCIIPKDLENTFSTKEFRISLKSSLYSHSKIISTNLYNISQFIFGEVRGGYMKDIAIEDVKNILRRKVNQTLKHIHLYERDTNKWNENELKERIDKIDEKEKKLKDRLKTDYKDTIDKIEKEVDKILITQNLKPDKNNFEYSGLIRKWTDLKVIRETWKRELLTGQRKYDEEYLNELEEEWKIGLFGKETDKVKPSTPEPETTKPLTGGASPLFSKVYPVFLEHMKRNRRRVETIEETKISYKETIEILGDKPIGNYTNMDGRDYRNTISQLPRNRRRVKKYREKTLKEVLSMKVPVGDRITVDTQMKLTSRMTALWNYLLDEYPEYVNENVFKSKSVRRSAKKQKDRRESFTEKDLQKIFNHKNYLPAIFENTTYSSHSMRLPYYFIPLLAIFTGCRLEEICMMRTKDIVRVKNIWIYRIREEGQYGVEETRVKNPYSERDIPLHSVLVDTLGFVRYVKHIKKLGHERVFHELPKSGNVYHKNVGRFFNDRYLKKIGLKDGGRKVSFHSIRHSVETHLTNQNVNPRFIDFLQGHSQKGIGGSVYMKGIQPEVLLKECVEKIDWGIDWEKLKVKWK